MVVWVLALMPVFVSARGLPPYFEFSPDREQAANAALTAREEEQLAGLLRDRDRLDATVWKAEIEAQRHEKVIDDLWDRLRRAKNPFAVAMAFAVDDLTLPVPGPARALKDGLLLVKPAAPGPPVDGAQWRARLAGWRAAGWVVDRTEWHHAEFHPEATPAWSLVKINVQATAPDGSRHEFRGGLRITWRAPAHAGDAPVVASVNAAGLDWLRRPAGPAFREILNVAFPRSADRGSTMLHAWDLDGDGRSELVLPGVNVVFRNLGGNRFAREPFLTHPVFPDPCGVIADLDGDGAADYLCTAGSPSRLLLYRGAPGGRFPGKPVLACRDALDLKAGSVIALADINGDGFLDAWVGQYRNPYFGGEFPSPYYNANDGYPCYLLLGDGTGHFRDATAGAGFDAKRRRRNYCASFLDLDGDGRPDLLTVNDFAGVDVWHNAGNGRFEDVTAAAVDDPMNFGMGLAVDDFSRNGHPGFYVSGMGSTTMRRLVQLGLKPGMGEAVTLSRTRMGYGSRMYLWDGPERYREPGWNDQVARSGWSWGVVGFDPDLDGDRDLYVLNGFISGRTSVDYCTRFWCHDVYTPPDQPPAVVRHLLAASTAELNRGEVSWNGYEKKKFFLRAGASEYIESAAMFGLALEADCRNLVADDFDGDGRPDLALLSEVRQPGGNAGSGTFKLTVLRNELETGHHWIGVRLAATGKAEPFGASVTVLTPTGPHVGVVLTGDSWRSQQAPVRHFGLGDDPRVDAIEVRWGDGRVTRLDHPAPDRYLDLAPPPRN